MRILYSSADLHDAIKHLLAAPERGDRRVVLVAYVGQHAEAFLPDPRGLKVVCSLEPGSTSPEALERLRGRGAEIFKAERLHMKVYWSSRRGCVLCSANASGHALGRGGLKEAGVWLPPRTVSIDRLLQYARPARIRNSDLRRLARARDDIAARGIRPYARPEPRPTFLEWLGMPSRKPWKLGWWMDSDLQIARAAKAESLSRYGVKEPYGALNSAKGQITRGGWLLCFELPKGIAPYWMYVDFVVKVTPSEKNAYERAYPFQAIQVHRPARYPAPPFTIDATLRRAFRAAVHQYGSDKLTDIFSLRPPAHLLRFIADRMK